MGIMDKMKSWRQDRQRVSMEKHEVDYIKKLAKKYLKDTQGLPEHHLARIRASSLQKMCKYILKTYPEVTRRDR